MNLTPYTFLQVKNMNPTPHIRYLRFAYVLAIVFTFAPPISFLNKYKMNKWIIKINTLYLILMVIAIPVGVVFSTEKQIFFSPIKTYSQIVLQTFCTILKTITLVIGALWNQKVNRKFEMLFQRIEEIDEIFKFSRSLNIKFLIEIILIQLFFCAILVLEANLWLETNTELYLCFLCGRYVTYGIIILTVLMGNLALVFKRRFRFVNQKLLNYQHQCSYFNWIKLIEIYISLNRSILYFNEIFGWRLLLTIGISLISILECINYLVRYEEKDFETYGSGIIIFSFISTGLWLVSNIIRKSPVLI